MSDNAAKNISLNFETVGSIAAMVIGASALFVAWDQAQVMRKQQHGSVWPVLSADFSIGEDETGLYVELPVANRGVGPALVENAIVLVDGEPVMRWVAFERRLFGENDPKGAVSFGGAGLEGSVIGPGEQMTLLRASWIATDENKDAFEALALRYVTGDGPDVQLSACYCSVFERCFQLSGDGRPATARHCPAPTGFFDTFFLEDQAAE